MADPPIIGTLAIELYHGRNDPDEQLEDWGFDGPVIGGILKFHVTYHSHLRLYFSDEAYAQRLAREYGWTYEGEEGLDGEYCLWIWFDGDLFPAGDKYYGDWTVFPEPAKPRKPPAETATVTIELTPDELETVLNGLDAYQYWEASDPDQRHDAAVIWKEDDENAVQLDDIERLYDRLFAILLTKKRRTEVHGGQ